MSLLYDLDTAVAVRSSPLNRPTIQQFLTITISETISLRAEDEKPWF